MVSQSANNPLFGPDLDWENNAFIHLTSDEWWPYISGYAKAAEILSDHVQSGSRDRDTLIYPIVFLSRHYLELLMKRTLLDAQDLLRRDRNLPGHHDLARLWRDLRPLILTLYRTDPPADLARLDSVVTSLTELDRCSFAFRYPVDKRGAMSLPNELTLVNIRRFSDTFREAVALLDVIQSGIAAQLEVRNELEHDV